MNKKLEWCIIIFLVLILIGLSACSPKTMFVDKQPPHETNQEMNDSITKDMDAMDQDQAAKENDGPTNFTGIADALSCIFAPDNCPLKKRKDEQKMDR